MTDEQKKTMAEGRKKKAAARKIEKDKQQELDEELLNKPFKSAYAIAELARQSPPKNRFKKKSTHKYRRRRKLYEYSPATTAIRNHCLECCGYNNSDTDNCTATACWLYPLRFGMSPERAHSLGKEVG